MKLFFRSILLAAFIGCLIGCQSNKPAAPAASNQQTTVANEQSAQPIVPVDNTPAPMRLYINDQEVPLLGLSSHFAANSMARIRFAPDVQVKLFKSVAGKLSPFPLSEEQKRNGLALLLQEIVQDSDWFFITSKEEHMLVDDRFLQDLVDRLPPLQIPKSQLVRPLMWRIYNVERTAESWELPGLSAHLKTTVEVCHAPFTMRLLVNKPGLSQYEFVPGTGKLTSQNRLQLSIDMHYKSHLAVWIAYPGANGIGNSTQIFPAPGTTVSQPIAPGQTVLIPEKSLVELADGQPLLYLLASEQPQFLADFTNWLARQEAGKPTVDFGSGVVWQATPYPHIRLDLQPKK